MVYTRRAVVLAALLIIVASYALGGVWARAITHTHTRTHTVHVVCSAWAEDTAAHIRLIAYDDGHATYRCMRHGY